MHALAGEGSNPLVCSGEARPRMQISQRCLLQLLGASLLRQAIHHLAVGWAMCRSVGMRAGCACEHMQVACSGRGGSGALVRTPELARSWNEGALPTPQDFAISFSCGLSSRAPAPGRAGS